MPDIFLSYSSVDRPFVARLVHVLQQQGWSVWWDQQLLPGQTWESVIEKVLDKSRCVVVVWSKSSITSEWVRMEAHHGRERAKVAPVLLEDVRIPTVFRQIQTVSLTEWDGSEGFNGILQLESGIRKILEGPTSATQTNPLIPINDERALDAAMPKELPVHEYTNLIAMIRRSDSPGLKAILADDDEYDLSPKDVVSKAVTITHQVDGHGRALPAEVLIRVISPGFEPAMQEKRIKVSRDRDSTVCSFLMRALEVGSLIVQVEIYQRDTCVASRLIRANGVPSGRVTTTLAHSVVSMPLEVNVIAAAASAALVAAPAAVPRTAAPAAIPVKASDPAPTTFPAPVASRTAPASAAPPAFPTAQQSVASPVARPSMAAPPIAAPPMPASASPRSSGSQSRSSTLTKVGVGVAGAAVIMLGMSATVVYGPKFFGTRANPDVVAMSRTSDSNPPVIGSAGTAASPVGSPGFNPAVSPPAGSSASTPAASAAASSPIVIAPTEPVAMPALASPAVEPVPAPVIAAAQLKELRQRFNDLSIRAAVAKEQVNELERRQAAQGLALRSDLREARTRIDIRLPEAGESLKRGDVEEARQNLTYVESAVTTIQRALGQ